MTEKNYTREDIDKACMQAVNRFNQFEFQVPDVPGEETGRKLAYNLYVPENMQAGETYPLVLFIHDMGSCSEDVTRTLTQEKARQYGRPATGRIGSRVLYWLLVIPDRLLMMIFG